MKNKTSNILMLAYILFIFVSLFTRHLYAQSKWNYIVTAITATSWLLVLSDVLDLGADVLSDSLNRIKPKLESYYYGIRDNKKLNDCLNDPLVDKYGNATGQTIGQALDTLEGYAKSSLDTLRKEEKTKKAFIIVSSIIKLGGFVLFFCILLFNPLFEYFYSKLDGMTVMSFGTILAGQFGANRLKEMIDDIEKALNTKCEIIDLLNQYHERKRVTDAD